MLKNYQNLEKIQKLEKLNQDNYQISIPKHKETKQLKWFKKEEEQEH
jgi:hypothetical protein